jgi:hydrogenase-4 component E
MLLAALVVALSFWAAGMLELPTAAPSELLVPTGLSLVSLGLLLLVNRKKAISQVVGFLVLENGVYVFGQCLAAAVPFAVELGILLDMLVGVFVMGIAIQHISRAFDDVDVDALSSLKE